VVKRYFTSRKMQDLGLAAIKRLPRLAGPVLVTVLASCLVFKLDLYFFSEASTLTASPWLASFAYAPKVLSPETASFSEAFTEGAWRTFVFGDNYYDTSLWTMWFEFWGSLAAFILAPILFLLHDRTPLLAWVALFIGMFVAWSINFMLVAFPVGLSLYLVLASTFRPNARLRAVIVVVALVLLGYAGNAVGAYRPLAILDFNGLSAEMRQAYVAIPASVMLVYAVLTMESPPSWMTGKVARFLGDLSFPLYLVHAPVICSLGSWVLLTSGSAPIAAAVAMLGSIIVALPLVVFKNWWVAALGNLVGRLGRRGGIVAAVPEAANI